MQKKEITVVSGFIDQPIGEDTLVFHPITREIFTCNQSAWSVLKLCREGLNQEQIVGHLQTSLPASREEAQEICLLGLEQLVQNGLVETSLGPSRRNFLKAALIPIITATVAKPAMAASTICDCASVTTAGVQTQHVGNLTGPRGSGNNCCATGLQPGFSAPGASPAGNFGCAGCVACKEGTSGLCSCRSDTNICRSFIFGAGTFVAETCVALVSQNDPNVCGN